MPVTSYVVNVTTRDEFLATDYTARSGELVNALQSTLGDAHKLRTLMHSETSTDPRVEVEVTQAKEAPSACITACCVVTATDAQKLAFDKNMFATMISTHLPFAVRVTKRFVTKEEQVAAQQLTEDPSRDVSS